MNKKKRKMIIDIESNGFLDKEPYATKIWCIVVKVFNEDKWYYYVCPEAGLDFLSSIKPMELLTQDGTENKLGKRKDCFEVIDCIIGHNIINYDLPLLKKLWRFEYKGDVQDTLLMSRVLYPDRPGGHSLENWMTIIGGNNQKVQNEAWDKWDSVMLERCKSDVLATEEVYKRLLEEIGTNEINN